MEKITNLELGYRDEIRFHLETMINDTEYYDDIDIEKMSKLSEDDIFEIARELLYDEYITELINTEIEYKIRKKIGFE